MTRRDKIGAIILLVLVVFFGILLARHAHAPNPADQDARDEANEETEVSPAPSAATSSTSTTPASTPRIRTFTLALGQPATVDGYRYVLRNIEDSRCPDGAQCIRAGEAKAFIQVGSGTPPKEVVLTSNGEWGSALGRSLRITKVLPAHPSQNIASYIVFLEMKR